MFVENGSVRLLAQPFVLLSGECGKQKLQAQHDGVLLKCSSHAKRRCALANSRTKLALARFLWVTLMVTDSSTF